jgi:hypothetical protein
VARNSFTLLAPARVTRATGCDAGSLILRHFWELKSAPLGGSVSTGVVGSLGLVVEFEDAVRRCAARWSGLG